MKINQYIEQTSLKPTMSDKEIFILVEQAEEYGFHGICIPPFWVKKAKRELSGKSAKLVTVIGFPLGYQRTEAKIEEIKCAIADGADELDLVINISAFKSSHPWVKIEIAKCAKLIHESEKLLKVIIESAYLTNEEIISISKMSVDAGADFIKTSTGYAPEGAKPEIIKLIKDHIPSDVGIKASGGIKSFEQAKALINAGATRIGTSSGIEIAKTVNSNSKQ